MLETLTKDEDDKENEDGLKDITVRPLCKETFLIQHVSSKPKETLITLKNKDLIQMRKIESYSSLDLLFQHPLDYMARYVLDFHKATVFSVPELETTMGIVAHGVVEDLCKLARKTGDTERKWCTGTEIKQRIESDFNKVFEDMIAQNGAILQLDENSLKMRTFQMELRESVATLAEIIEANNLRVFDNEYRLKMYPGTIAYDKIPKSFNKKRAMKQLHQLPSCFIGYVDLLLEDRFGRKYIIDMKWTRSKRHRGYLENDTSLQLEMYEFFTSVDTNSEVVATGYYIMPSKQLITTSKALKGRNIIYVEKLSKISITDDDRSQIDGINEIDTNNLEVQNSRLWDRICNSYIYRRDQLLQGLVENSEDELMEDIQYVLDTEQMDLVPLSEHDNLHYRNFYSDIDHLKLNNLK